MEKLEKRRSAYTKRLDYIYSNDYGDHTGNMLYYVFLELMNFHLFKNSPQISCIFFSKNYVF